MACYYWVKKEFTMWNLCWIQRLTRVQKAVVIATWAGHNQIRYSIYWSWLAVVIGPLLISRAMFRALSSAIKWQLYNDFLLPSFRHACFRFYVNTISIFSISSFISIFQTFLNPIKMFFPPNFPKRKDRLFIMYKRAKQAFI